MDFFQKLLENLPINNRLLAIGNVCAQWSSLEYTASLCIWWILKLDEDTGKIVTGGLDMLPRINMAINLARHTKAPKALIDQLVLTRKGLQDGLLDRRNEAVHGVTFTTPEKDKYEVEVHRGKGGRNRKPLANDDLFKLGRSIHELNNGLRAVLNPLAGFTA